MTSAEAAGAGLERLRARARAWLAEDPDPATRDELARLLAGPPTELAERFGGRLEFGTAGLRGPLGAGPTRMNRVMVRRAAAGLLDYLAATGTPGPLVVGYDARHNSAVFAADTARVATGAGRPAAVLRRPLPTPVLAFSVRRLDAAAGVMVTASHNPAPDNGYKVYLADGAQLVAPADADISAAIDAARPLAGIRLGPEGAPIAEDIVEEYLATAVVAAAPPGPRALRIAYTPMHGVGGAVLRAALERAGFPPPAVVAAQADPDPEFPTAAFPNPEEPGATGLLLELASRVGADLALANDPDADRLAVAVPTPAGWRQLTGDEVGALLGDDLLRRAGGPDGRGVTWVVASSVVSSSLLGRLAAEYGVIHRETLTGFKWIARAADQVPGGRLLFGYEEALGYAVSDAVRDKDGISAALAVAALAAADKAVGRSLTDRLDELDRRHGRYATAALSIRVSGLDEVLAMMSRVRRRPPTELADRQVRAVEDLRDGLGGLPPTDAVRWQLGGHARVVVRPSGTEPKLKAYLEVVLPYRERDRAPAELEELRGAVAAVLAGG